MTPSIRSTVDEVQLDALARDYCIPHILVNVLTVELSRFTVALERKTACFSL